MNPFGVYLISFPDRVSRGKGPVEIISARDTLPEIAVVGEQVQGLDLVGAALPVKPHQSAPIVPGLIPARLGGQAPRRGDGFAGQGLEICGIRCDGTHDFFKRFTLVFLLPVFTFAHA